MRGRRSRGLLGAAAADNRALHLLIGPTLHVNSASLTQSAIESANAAKRRRVFFVAGFDPRGAQGYYHRLRDALAPFAVVDPLERPSPHISIWRWRNAAIDFETTFEFLHWDDIVARHWRAKGRLQAQLAALRALIVYQRCGLLARARNGGLAVRWALLTMGLAPLAIAAMAILVASGAGVVGALSLPHGAWLALPGLAFALFAADRVWRALNLEWLAKGFACIVETARGEAPNWDERCAAFAKRIAEVERNKEADEIVVIGHSLGAILAMKALARYCADGERPTRPIAFATLGNVIPFYTWIDRSRGCMREGESVATSPFVDWIDVTSGSDPASACRMGPLVGSHVQVPRWEPEFHRVLAPERFRHIRRRPLDFHFQYMRSADRADGFDLVRMLSSPAPFFADAPR